MARIRTFLALNPGPVLRERVQDLQDELAAGGAPVKWVEAANLHLTLLFLGEVGDRDLVAICRATSKVAAELEPIPLMLEGVGCFPNMRRPRVLWVGVGDGAAAVKMLHAALETALLELGCYRREARPYTPHLTLGRLDSDDGDEALLSALLERENWQGGETTIQEVLIMGSELMRNGPVYTVLGRAPLLGSGRQNVEP